MFRLWSSLVLIALSSNVWGAEHIAGGTISKVGRTVVSAAPTSEKKEQTTQVPLSIGAYVSRGNGERLPYFLYSEVKDNLEDLTLDEKKTMVEFFKAIKGSGKDGGKVFGNEGHIFLKAAYDEGAKLKESDFNMSTNELLAIFGKWLKVRNPFLRVALLIDNQRPNGKKTAYKIKVSVCGERTERPNYEGEISCSGTNPVALTPEIMAKEDGQPDFLHRLLVDHMTTLAHSNDAFVGQPAQERVQKWKNEMLHKDAEELSKEFRGSARAF